jgi:DNA-binding NarL/FixJ family response regulator
LNVGGPQPGEAGLNVVARAIVALSSARSDVEEALGAADFEVRRVADASEVIDHVGGDQPVIVVLDEAHGDWFSIVPDLIARRPNARPVLLAKIDGVEEFMAAVAAGVAGFCSPDADAEAIVRSVQSVCRSGVAIPRTMVPPLVEHVRHGRGRRVRTAAGPVDLTEREWEVVQLMMQRRSTREMADELFVSVGTVRSHVSTLMSKLGAVDREDAIAMIEHARRS